MFSIRPKLGVLRAPVPKTVTHQGSGWLRNSDAPEVSNPEAHQQSNCNQSLRIQRSTIVLLILYLSNALCSWSPLLDPSEELGRFIRVVLQQHSAATAYKSDLTALASKDGIALRKKLTDQLWTTPADPGNVERPKGFTKAAQVAAKRCRHQLDGGVNISGSISTQELHYTWTLDPKILEVHVRFSLASGPHSDTWADGWPTWAAVGFTQEGGMRGADVVVLREARGVVALEDRWSVEYDVPEMDQQQDYTLLNYSWSSDEISFAFQRSLLTGDVKDWNIVAAPVQIIWALGQGQGFQNHRLKGSLWVDLFRGERLESRPNNVDAVVKLGDFMLRMPLSEESVVPHDACRDELKAMDVGPEEVHVALALCLGRRGDLLLGRSALEEAVAFNSSIDAILVYEEMLSDHLLARILLRICRLGDATSGFAFTRCRLTRGTSLLGEVPGALLAMGNRLAHLAALVFGVARVSLHWQCGIFAVALLYCDAISAAVHLVMDNYNMIRWPIIRPQALGFQSHHQQPIRSLNFPYHRELSNLSAAIMAGSLLFVLAVFPVQRRLADASRCLLFYSIPLSMFLMHTHAFAHLHPHEVPDWVQLAQHWGILLRPEDHTQHHMHFAKDFGVLNGWSHPVFNWALRHIMHHQDENWAWVFLMLLLLPAGCVATLTIANSFSAVSWGKPPPLEEVRQHS